MGLNNLLFFLILILFSYFFNKYSFLILKKINSKLLVDDQFEKPQAFHQLPIPLLGGIGIFFSLIYRRSKNKYKTKHQTFFDDLFVNFINKI